MNHVEGATGQLPSPDELQLLRFTSLGSDLTGAWGGESFWEIAAGIDFQITFEALCSYQPANREPFHRFGHDVGCPLC